MKRFYLSKDELIDSKEIDSYYEKIEEFNKQLVDIHCSLTSDTNDLQNFYCVQEDLDKLTEKFYVFNFHVEEQLKSEIRKNKIFGRFLKYCILIYAFFIVAPKIGILLTIYLETYNYINTKANKAALEELERHFESMQRQFKIIKKNIEVKYYLLNEKIKEFANAQKPFSDENKEDLTYYYALQMISYYLSGYEVNLEEVDKNILVAMKYILQEHLKNDFEDVNLLLNETQNGEKKLIFKK